MNAQPLRQYSTLDRILIEAERMLRTAFVSAPPAQRPNPADLEGVVDAALDPRDAQHAAGLMRVNHTGEVCAQALYFGQAAVARDEATREHLMQAAAEEIDHLAWCEDRLRELDSRPSHLNLLWYGGAFTLGALAGIAGDRWSYGFVIETENQVEAHLATHLDRLPPRDQRSRAIIRVMQADEIRHAGNAAAAGGMPLPEPIPKMMALAAAVMKALAYRI